MAKATTGILMGGLSGKAGTVVFVRGATGETYVRTRVRPNNPQTEAQMQVRGYLTEAGQAWRNMTTAEVRNWQSYAETLGPPSGRHNAITVFTGLAVKYRQAGGQGPIPVVPPTQRFTGDGIRVVADSPSAGVLRFSASAPNAEGIVTELLVQPLPSPHRKPMPRRYRPAAFVGFAPGNLTYDVPLRPGFYACAVRFVKSSTGQMSGLVELAVVTVG